MRRPMVSNRFWMDKSKRDTSITIGNVTASHAIKPIFAMVNEKIGDCECKDIWLLEDGKPSINLELLCLQLDGVISRRTRMSRQRRDTIASEIATNLAIMFD